jgi:ABC-type Na+ transport system ATPase subunit NatA
MKYVTWLYHLLTLYNKSRQEITFLKSSGCQTILFYTVIIEIPHQKIEHKLPLLLKLLQMNNLFTKKYSNDSSGRQTVVTVILSRVTAFSIGTFLKFEGSFSRPNI